MKIEIVYDSKTGTTRKAAKLMGEALQAVGHDCRVQDVSQANPAEVSQADLVCVGSWVKGLFIVLQHPTAETMQFIDQLGDLSGKKAVVFCTYKLATGPVLPRMSKALKYKGANVVGIFKYRGYEPTSDFTSFVESLAG